MPQFTAPDGTTLAYAVRGTGDPLLCLPGGPMRAGAYLGDLGGLTGHRTLVVLDARGTGASAVPADPETYRCDHQVADVEALRAHLGLDRADLLAHSAGGDLALLYAARHPDRVRSLTQVTARARAVGVDFTEEHRQEAAALRAGEPWFEPAHAAYRRIWAGSDADADWDAIGPFFYGRWDDAARGHAAAGEAQCNAEAADRYAEPAAFDPPATRAALARLDAPVLLLAGELDGGPRPRVAAEVAELVPRAEVVVLPAAGHFPWLDDPGRFTRTVTRFLSGVSGGRGAPEPAR